MQTLTKKSNKVQFLFFERQKNFVQEFWFKDLVCKKPFGYRVMHHGYSLMSCPGHLNCQDI